MRFMKYCLIKEVGVKEIKKINEKVNLKKEWIRNNIFSNAEISYVRYEAYFGSSVMMGLIHLYGSILEKEKIKIFMLRHFDVRSVKVIEKIITIFKTNKELLEEIEEESIEKLKRDVADISSKFSEKDFEELNTKSLFFRDEKIDPGLKSSEKDTFSEVSNRIDFFKDEVDYSKLDIRKVISNLSTICLEERRLKKDIIDKIALNIAMYLRKPGIEKSVYLDKILFFELDENEEFYQKYSVRKITEVFQNFFKPIEKNYNNYIIIFDKKHNKSQLGDILKLATTLSFRKEANIKFVFLNEPYLEIVNYRTENKDILEIYQELSTLFSEKNYKVLEKIETPLQVFIKEFLSKDNLILLYSENEFYNGIGIDLKDIEIEYPENIIEIIRIPFTKNFVIDNLKEKLVLKGNLGKIYGYLYHYFHLIDRNKTYLERAEINLKKVIFYERKNKTEH